MLASFVLSYFLLIQGLMNQNIIPVFQVRLSFFRKLPSNLNVKKQISAMRLEKGSNFFKTEVF